MRSPTLPLVTPEPAQGVLGYRLTLSVVVSPQGREWRWQTDVIATAAPGMDVKDVEPCLVRQGQRALSAHLKKLSGGK